VSEAASHRPLRALAVAAATLGSLAAFAGSPYAVEHGHLDVAALSRAVQHEDDHVTALELAGWIKERRAGLRVIDVRSQADYDTYHVPTAERVSIDSLPTVPFRRDETIVLYSEGGPHAAQGWVFLRALGYEKVFFLRGGLYEWLEQVMSPALRAGAPPTDSVAFVPIAAISRYFGGVPRFGVTPGADDAIALPRTDSAVSPFNGAPRTSATTSLVSKIRRRGC
jgi:rhodanese-related sulfurtransferase